jgi:hypothetical protein
MVYRDKLGLMITDLLKRNFIIWLGLFVLAFANGAIREVGIKKFIGEPWAHHLSALTAFLIFGSYVWFLWGKTKITATEEAVWVGAFWFFLTVLTETFVLNRWVSKLSWEQILQSYNLARGELWPLVLVWVGLLPIIVQKIKGPAE